MFLVFRNVPMLIPHLFQCPVRRPFRWQAVEMPPFRLSPCEQDNVKILYIEYKADRTMQVAPIS